MLPLPRFITFLLALLFFPTARTFAVDPQLTSWFTANSGKYARIYVSTANETAGTTASKASEGWTRTTNGTTYAQTNPAYADVNEIYYSANWVYIRSTGLASHIMGPWYLDVAKSQNFPSFPSNTSVLYRIPRTPTIPASKTLTGLGATGRMVNGVAMFDSRDAFSYKGTPSFTDATPTNGVTGDGIWNRDGWFNEGVTFDPALAHQAGNNYHYHAHPIALRYQLGDHVDYNATTNRYTESASAPTQHSPIVAWAADGLPVYGPYGYSSPMNAASGVRRMVSGFALRDGTNGTTAITVRQVLPLWAQRIQGKTTLTSAQYGPDVNTTYGPGHYIEDFDYRGDLGQTLGTDFDLNEQNVRFCVTPEFPAGTWAYFTTINADGTPQFPYTTGRAYYGSPTGGSPTAADINADTVLTQQFIGGANKALAINSANVSGTNVTLTWSAVEGGTYSVDASSAANFSTFTNKATGLFSTGTSKSTSYTALGSSGTEYGRVNRTALATYDTAGQTAATTAQSTTTSYSLTPNNAPTITSISNASTMKNNATTALSFTVGDAETAVTSLTVTGSSSNTTLVPNANIVISGSGASRTVTVTPASGQVGTATITVAVSDGTTSTSTTFTVTVKPPNILLVVADDLGLDALSLYSSLLGNAATGTFAPTPNITALASNGLRFNKAYTYTVCSPSRSCILTGRYGYRTGTGNVVAASSNNFLQSTEFTLPKAFAANSPLNFQLKHFGKWHLTAISGATANQGPCTIGGWPAFTGSLPGQLSDFYSWTKVISDGTAGGTSSSTSTTYETTDLVNDAVSYINTQQTAGKPWFATLALNAPHVTQSSPFYQLPPTSLCPAYASLVNTSADILANPRSYFNAMIQALDTELGRLLQSVDLAKTNVIFVGDNGTYGSNAPNSGSVIQAPYNASHSKATLYEGGIRVPLIIAGPDVTSPGRTTDALTHFVDLYSTILEMAGINVAATVPSGTVVDSHSLLPVLKNTTSTQSSLIYGEEFDVAFPTLGGRCLRDSQYKVIRKATGSDEFYDLSADPYEATNLIASGTGSLSSPQLTAYNNLVTQLATFNTAPTVSSIVNQTVAMNTATSAIPVTVGDAELSAALLTVTGASSNTTLVPTANVVIGGSGASRTVTVTPATGQTGTSTITVSATDGAFTTNSSFTLTVTSGSTPTSVSSIVINPTTPTNTDTVNVSATVTPATGTTISSVTLAYNTAAGTTTNVFTETMGTAAAGFTTAANGGTNNAWTVTFAQPQPNGPFSFTTAANHGTGNAFGLEMNRGTPNLTDNYITTTNNIDASGGNSAYVEFWFLTANLGATNGWTFQTSTNGTTFTTRTTTPVYNAGTNLSSYTMYHYDLTPSERVSTLKLRFQFAGNGPTNPASKISLDDIKVVTVSTPTPITMTSTGGGTYVGTIPAQTAGTTVSYTITATDSSSGTATGTGSYTVQTAAPVLAVTPSTTLAASGAAGGSTFTPSSLAYTLTNIGTGTMSWTASKTAAWLNLSATSGTLAAGATTTVTASINTSSASGLSAATYNDTITFANTTNSSGNTTRAASLLVTNGTPAAPDAPVISTLPLYSAGTSKTIVWPAVATATSYTLQIASSSNFTTSLLASQTVTSPGGSFANLSDGATYYYRVLATNSIGSSSYSATVSSTQDTVAPAVAISSPTTGTTSTTNTITVTGTASDSRSSISGVKVNNVAATSSNSFANWTATIPLGFGGNAITATATDGAGNTATSSAVVVNMTTFQTYNPLIIPDAITGTTFNLDLYQTNKRFPTWTATNPTLGINPSTTLGGAPGTTTLGYNGALMWGPTLIMNKGDTVQLNVTNHLDQSTSTLLRSTTTTVHWHGFHIPAIMDGGPRQVIAAGTTWSPTFTVKNDAATYWYHPHLHMATQEQLTLGAGGMIIVRDPQEAALNLPRTYGVDDIPLAVTTRRFLSPTSTNEFSANQYVQSDGSTSSTDNYGDYVLINGTMNPQISLPQQYVRLRILCADIQRGYRIGFSDNRNFYVIANDQGMLNTPQLVSQVTMMIGERVEILVNLGNDTIGSSLDLVAYDNLGTAGGLGGALGGFGGSESSSSAPNGNIGRENGGLLCNSDFKLLHINVASPTANPVTSVPSTLASNTYLTAADATTSRTISIANGNGGTPGFTFDGTAYSPTFNNFTIPLNAVEKWTFNGGQVFGHSIHIHDIKFKVVSRNVTNGGANTNQIFNTVGGTATLIGSAACANYESGWKDTVYVPRGESVSVVAKYDDFASPTNPYMLHCHMLNHEDGGLMGQFVVTSAATESIAVASVTRTGSNNLINFQFNATTGSSYVVQYSPDMTTGSWQTIGTVTSDGTSATFTEGDSTRLGQARGFYRAVIQSVVTPPVITSSTTATATRGTAFSYQITATNSPTGFGAILLSGTTALPGGLSVNTKTGLVSGTIPTGTAAGTYNIDVMASNSGGTSHAKVVLTVN